MTMTKDELIEAMADALFRYRDPNGSRFWGKDRTIDQATAALSALETALSIDLTAIAEGRAVVVPASRTFGLVTFCACPIGQEEECSHNQCARAVLAARGK